MKTSNGLVFVLIIFLLGTLSCATPFRETETLAPPKNVILISWDGVQQNHLRECLARKELPHLQALINEGIIVQIDVTHRTDTKAGHAQMLTGYEPETTGVYGNGNFRPIPPGYTIFERLEEHFGAQNIATIMLTGKAGNVGGKGPRVVKDKKTGKERKVPGEPFFLTKNDLDEFDSNAAPATVVGPKALGYLDKYKDMRFFAFFHFSDPDSKGHRFGENSPEYTQAIITCDEWLGKIVARLKEYDLCEKTVIYVTTDHGFDEGRRRHSMAPYIFLATSDKRVKRRGNQRDIAPTILSLFMEVEKIEPPFPGRSLAEPEKVW